MMQPMHVRTPSYSFRQKPAALGVAVCAECDLVVRIPALMPGSRASCPRCGYHLASAYRDAIERILVFSLSGLLCLLYSAVFGFVDLSVIGQQRAITLIETVEVLYGLNELVLALILLGVVLGLPLLFLAALSALAFSLWRGSAGPRTILLLRFVGWIHFWNMAEIFLLGILVSMIKVAAMADIGIGLGFYSYALFNLFMLTAVLHFDPHHVGVLIRQQARQRAIDRSSHARTGVDVALG
jgi:paraquat-inducible protein A